MKIYFYIKICNVHKFKSIAFESHLKVSKADDLVAQLLSFMTQKNKKLLLRIKQNKEQLLKTRKVIMNC